MQRKYGKYTFAPIGEIPGNWVVYADGNSVYSSSGTTGMFDCMSWIATNLAIIINKRNRHIENLRRDHEKEVEELRKRIEELENKVKFYRNNAESQYQP